MRTCMIVDDSEIIRGIARRILEDMGFACVEADGGQQALDICGAGMPEVVLLDQHTQCLECIEFLRRLRQMHNGNFPKIIFCATVDNAAIIQEALDAGADECMVKPFDRETIRKKLIMVGALG